MKRFLWFVTGTLLIAAPCALQAAPSAGAHAYDWMIGTWSCTNTLPSMMGGPANQTRTVARANGGLSLLVAGRNFERSGYIAYVSSTNTWWNPFSYANGNYASESTASAGRKAVWTGSYFNAATATTIPVRDTVTMLGPSKYTDVGQYRSGGAWKTGYSGTCTKS